MRIAIFTDTYEPQRNGVVTSINLFKAELERQGHKVLVFCPKAAELKGRRDTVQFSSVPFRPYPEYRFAVPGPKMLLSVRKFKPDVIHAQSPGPIGIMGMSTAKLLKIPFIFTYHTDLDNYTDYIPFKTFRKTSKNVLMGLLRAFMEKSDLVIFPGEEIGKRFKGKINANVTVLPTGIPSKALSHRKGKERYVLQVGRLCKERHVDILLRAFRKLPQNVMLYVTSEGPEKEILQKLAENLGIADRTKFLGYVSEKEKIDLYRHAEMFVTPSPTDTQGLVALEAMQYGTPVIAARAGGFLDYIQDKRNGLFFRPNDHRDLANKMRRLLKDRTLWKRLSKSGYETVKNYDIRRVTEKLVDAYKCSNRSVSVVVCARNEEKFIGHCLRALSEQTVMPEIIVVDGRSTDGTLKIAKNYADKIISDGGKGIAYARNLGWKNASGEIVAYCDADALPPPDWVENITRLMRTNAAVHGPIVPYDGDLKTRANLKLCSELFMRVGSKLRYPIVCAANAAFRKSIIKKYPFRFNAPLEDFDVGNRIRHAGRVKCFQELTMPVSARRYAKNFYRDTIRCYLVNFARIKMGREPRNFGYFEKSK
jgi:1,2-diacylglycerol 3-alpha-glucosyltransferase